MFEIVKKIYDKFKSFLKSKKVKNFLKEVLKEFIGVLIIIIKKKYENNKKDKSEI